MTDIIIIGSGPGGYKAAGYAARHGKTVTVIERGFTKLALAKRLQVLRSVPTKSMWLANISEICERCCLFGKNMVMP